MESHWTLVVPKTQTKAQLLTKLRLKRREKQFNWQPWDHEDLAITAGIKHFSPYNRESPHPLQVLMDSKPCVQEFNKH